MKSSLLTSLIFLVGLLYGQEPPKEIFFISGPHRIVETEQGVKIIVENPADVQVVEGDDLATLYNLLESKTNNSIDTSVTLKSAQRRVGIYEHEQFREYSLQKFKLDLLNKKAVNRQYLFEYHAYKTTWTWFIDDVYHKLNIGPKDEMEKVGRKPE